MTACFLALQACGGGGGGGGTVTPVAHAQPAGAPVTAPTAGPAGFAPVSFSISLPKSTSSVSKTIAAVKQRKPQFVPTSTTAISVSVNSTTPQTFPCTPPVCTGSFLAPAGGSVNFLFSALDSQSRVIANAPLTQVISANGTNQLVVTLNGVVANAMLIIGPTGLSSAANGQAFVGAVAYDVDGDVLVGTYSAPIVISTNDATGTVSVANASLANDTQIATINYTYSAATAYVENHLRVGGSSSTETTAQPTTPFEVGRTFYTFTANSVVGFGAGSTSPTRTMTVPQAFSNVSAVGCDGTNLYVLDKTTGTLYGFTPAAAAPTISYTSDLAGPVWLAGYGGGAQPGNHGQFYASNGSESEGVGIVGFQGAASAPPFAIPADSATQNTGFTGNYNAMQTDATGNLYLATGGPFEMYGGYVIFNPGLTAQIASGTNQNTQGSNQIAIDTTVNPPRIYTEDSFFGQLGLTFSVNEYDNHANSPTFTSADSAGSGLFVDPSGNIYTSVAGGTFHVYAPGTLSSGNARYSLPGQSLAFDSAGYVYAVTAAGTVSIYPPGSTTASATLTGTYDQTAAIPNQFGAFCQ